MKVMLLNPPSKYAKNVVRDLIYGCWCKGKRIASASFPPTTLLLISAVLKKEGHDVILLDSQAERKDLKEVKKDAKKEDPEILIIPTSTMSFNEDVQTLDKIKKVTNITTLAFGSHATFMPLASLERDGIDYLVMREPEYIIRDFVNRVEKRKNPRKIKGLAYKKDGKKIINPPYPFIRNLDELPFPDRTPILKYAYFNPIVKKIPWTTAFTSRGCPGRCNFCTSPAFYGRRLRFRSPESVVKEMEEIKNLGYNEVFFRDETFTANKIRLIKICELILKRKLEMSWICNARIGNVDKKVMKLMKRAGCHLIKFGVESGSQKILDNIKKDIGVRMTRKTFKWANEIGMKTHAHLMLGCIGETKETIEKTIQFVKEIKPTTITANIFTPFPGSEVFEMVKKVSPEIGDGTDCDLSKIHTTGFFNETFSDVNGKELEQAIKKIYIKFYFRPSYILRRLLSISSLDEFRRTLLAGLDILSFSFWKED